MAPTARFHCGRRWRIADASLRVDARGHLARQRRLRRRGVHQGDPLRQGRALRCHPRMARRRQLHRSGGGRGALPDERVPVDGGHRHDPRIRRIPRHRRLGVATGERHQVARERHRRVRPLARALIRCASRRRLRGTAISPYRRPVVSLRAHRSPRARRGATRPDRSATHGVAAPRG